jgi:hypothetical protein
MGTVGGTRGGAGLLWIRVILYKEAAHSLLYDG